MEHKSLTQEEIYQAKELQRLGICQGAREWIWLGDYKGHAEHLLSSEESPPEVLYELLGYRVNWGRIGPLATASECWPEMLKIAPTNDSISEVFKYAIPYLTEGFGCMNNLDRAFRQALIELKKDTK